MTLEDRGRFLLDYIDLLEAEGPPAGDARSDASPEAEAGRAVEATAPRASYDRWVVNKLRALCGYYTKGFEGGGTLRVAVNQAPDVAALRGLITEFFGIGAGAAAGRRPLPV